MNQQRYEEELKRAILVSRKIEDTLRTAREKDI